MQLRDLRACSHRRTDDSLPDDTNKRQQLLKGMDFDYVLLDLQIPAKANRGGADKQYGINLLKDIQRMKAPSPPPVIMMTAHLADGFNLSSELQRNGVRECIAKPFSDAARPLVRL